MKSHGRCHVERMCRAAAAVATGLLSYSGTKVAVPLQIRCNNLTGSDTKPGQSSGRSRSYQAPALQHAAQAAITLIQFPGEIS